MKWKRRALLICLPACQLICPRASHFCQYKQNPSTSCPESEGCLEVPQWARTQWGSGSEGYKLEGFGRLRVRRLRGGWQLAGRLRIGRLRIERLRIRKLQAGRLPTVCPRRKCGQKRSFLKTKSLKQSQCYNFWHAVCTRCFGCSSGTVGQRLPPLRF